ncbi:MAG: hypothetical protein IJG07_10635 [Prevotella sp.]|nr:hypothetical protein [Prevotella sp.]
MKWDAGLLKKTMILSMLIILIAGMNVQNSLMEDAYSSQDIQKIIEEIQAMYPGEKHHSVSGQFFELIKEMDEEEIEEIVDLFVSPLFSNLLLGASGYDYECMAYAENGETFSIELDWTDGAVEEAETIRTALLSVGLESVCGNSSKEIFIVSSKPALISTVSIYVRNYDPRMGNAILVLDLPGNRQFVPGSKVALVLGLSADILTADLQVFEGKVCDDHTVEVEFDAVTLTKLSYKSTHLSVFI